MLRKAINGERAFVYGGDGTFSKPFRVTALAKIRTQFISIESDSSDLSVMITSNDLWSVKLSQIREMLLTRCQDIQSFRFLKESKKAVKIGREDRIVCEQRKWFLGEMAASKVLSRLSSGISSGRTTLLSIANALCE